MVPIALFFNVFPLARIKDTKITLKYVTVCYLGNSSLKSLSNSFNPSLQTFSK